MTMTQRVNFEETLAQHVIVFSTVITTAERWGHGIGARCSGGCLGLPHRSVSLTVTGVTVLFFLVRAFKHVQTLEDFFHNKFFKPFLLWKKAVQQGGTRECLGGSRYAGRSYTSGSMELTEFKGKKLSSRGSMTRMRKDEKRMHKNCLKAPQVSRFANVLMITYEHATYNVNVLNCLALFSRL